MKKVNKNPVLAAKQRHEIKHMLLLQILSCLKENINALNVFRIFEIIGIIICWTLILKWG